MKSLLLASAFVSALFLADSTVRAAPKPKPFRVEQSKAVVAPKARALFARAAKLYSGAQKLRFNWKVRDEVANTTRKCELRFDRKGRFLLHSNIYLNINGQTLGIYNKYENTYGEQKLVPDQIRDELENQLQSMGSIEDGLGVVTDKSPLEAEALQLELTSYYFETLRASVLPALAFGGQTCDRVRITQVQRAFKDSSLVNTQQIFWFARSDGRLMRWQLHKTRAGQTDKQTDSQVTLQDFNPTFSASEFVLIVPKGAKRQTLG